MIENSISVLGSGAFATGLAYAISPNGKNIKLWNRSDEVCREINIYHSNKKIKSIIPSDDFLLPTNIIATSSLCEVFSKSNIVIVAIPAQTVRQVFEKILSNKIPLDHTHIIIASKGIEESTGMLMSEVIDDVFSAYQQHRCMSISVLGGPNFARDMLKESMIFTTIAGKSDLNMIENAISSDYLRIQKIDDLIGLQIASAMKNVYSIICGALSSIVSCDSLISAFIAAAFNEMMKIGMAIGADAKTFLSQGGIGDLVATCSSKESRNYNAGMNLLSGNQSQTDLAEGLLTLNGLEKFQIRHNLDDDLMKFPKILQDFIREKNSAVFLEKICSAIGEY